MEKAIDSLIDITYMSELILDIPKTIARQKCQGLDFHHNLASLSLAKLYGRTYPSLEQ